MVRAHIYLFLVTICALATITGCAQREDFAADYADAYGSGNHTTTASRDYWYFDRSRSRGSRSTSGVLDSVGSLVRETQSAPVTVRVLDSKWYFDNGGLINNITAFYAEGDKTNARYSPLGVVIPPRGSLSYVEVTLRSDSSKWYFDRTGNVLPDGYVPAILLRTGDGFIFVKSSDLFDKVQLVFADGSHRSVPCSAFYARFPVEQPILGVNVRLKSDGSKWFIDNAGAAVPCAEKWFEDVD